MLPRYHHLLTGERMPEVRKYADGRDVSDRGAFPAGKVLRIETHVPRSLGDGGVVVRLRRDGEPSEDIPLSFVTTEKGIDTYAAELTLPKGLYYWELLFVRGKETLFTSSVNNKDFTLTDRSESPFRALIYEEGSGAPDWYRGGTMYQIFPDRFCRGSTPVPVREDAVLEADWYEGQLEYAEIPGGDVKNDRFFGGTLYGVIEKLDYLRSLGVSIVYLNPIFEAYSNHKYDTGNYERVDEMLGGDEALKRLLTEAERKGIRVILDGVFNHTGSDSKYFNRNGRYPCQGAYQTEKSRYSDWYCFGESRDDYECWWSIKILPRLNHGNERCRRYFTGEDGIGARYVKKGIGGWRLDVADELSDEFLDEFSASVKAARRDAVIIGEVWENASDKIAYGKRRRYFQDGQLDSVMNYPIRRAVISFCRGGGAPALYNVLTEIYASYPPRVADSLMNLLDSHDTERILTCLGVSGDEVSTLTPSEKACFRLTEEEYARGVRLLRIAAAIQYTVYGVPSLYYGDEVGMQGFGDPFCRRPLPWGREDEALLSYYRALGRMRERERVFADGSFKAVVLSYGAIELIREGGGDRILTLASREACELTVPLDGRYEDLLTGDGYEGEIVLPPDTAFILKRIQE